MKILVVDDNLESLQNICVFLQKTDYIVLPSASSKQALGIAFSKKPHLILIDMIMPEIDGFSFCELLKLNPETAEITVVFMKNRSMNSNHEILFKSKVADVINKPIVENIFLDWLYSFENAILKIENFN